ncbi:MAG: hypothetical protein AAF327_00525 [Cyanobacteria bacterium P01_A01_bin.37]
MTPTKEAPLLETYACLKQPLLNFVLEAEGDIATSLEKFSADQARRWSINKLQGIRQTDLAVDMFSTEGKVNDLSILDTFIANTESLSTEHQSLVLSWKRSFNGCFAVLEALPNSFVLMNWLTGKRYSVNPNSLQSEAELNRLSPKEIIMTRLSPIGDNNWTFSGPMQLLGKLGKPKLAVAIGNFKSWFPQHLYGDAPELLEEAWKSVEQYYHEFVSFFGSDQITLSGYALSKKLQDYQDRTTQRQLNEAGLDSSKSLQELAKDAGISDTDLEESMAAMGKDGDVARHLLKSQKALKMVMPTINLPKELLQADAVTTLVHPRWGQTFLKDYTRLVSLLKNSDGEAETEQLDALVLRYLKEHSVNAHVWQCLVTQAPIPLEQSLKRVLNRSDINIESDLESILIQFDKPTEPQLPDTASVPLHLHNLFQEAMKDVVGDANSKSKNKNSKKKGKRKTGFGA